jgi:dynein heavy chain
MADLLKLADELKFSRKFEKVSLGQGQGPKAEKLLEAGMERGLWVCLQNCHLAISWMPTLERIMENIQPDKVRLRGVHGQLLAVLCCSKWWPAPGS